MFWLIINSASGSVSADAIAAVEAALTPLVGQTCFPDDPLPDAAALAEAGATMVVVFAGDGTINAVARALDGWDGRLLVLPGGTMNLLSRKLHGAATATDIVARIGPDSAAAPLPMVISGDSIAFVNMLAGPLTAWVHAREAVRAGLMVRVVRRVRYAWKRSFGRGVRVIGADSRGNGRQQAVVITPLDDRLEVASIGFSGWMGAVALGAEFLAGDWRSSSGVVVTECQQLALGGAATIHALFDGESSVLPAPVAVRHSVSRLLFLTTVDGTDLSGESA